MTPRICAGVLICLFSLPINACDDNSLPIRYLQAIQALEWDTQGNMLAEDARYYDPTMVHYDRPAIELFNRADIVAFWRSSSEVSGTSAIRYTVRSCFETADHYVLHYDILVDVAGSFWDIDEETLSIPGQVMSVIRVANGLIVEHIDYVDYAGGDAFVESLKASSK